MRRAEAMRHELAEQAALAGTADAVEGVRAMLEGATRVSKVAETAPSSAMTVGGELLRPGAGPSIGPSAHEVVDPDGHAWPATVAPVPRPTVLGHDSDEARMIAPGSRPAASARRSTSADIAASCVGAAVGVPHVRALAATSGKRSPATRAPDPDRRMGSLHGDRPHLGVVQAEPCP